MLLGLGSSLSPEKLSDEQNELLCVGNVKQQVTRHTLFLLCFYLIASICYHTAHDCKSEA